MGTVPPPTEIVEIASQLLITGTKGNWDVQLYMRTANEAVASFRSVRPTRDFRLFERRDDARIIRDTVEMYLAEFSTVYTRIKTEKRYRVVKFNSARFPHNWQLPLTIALRERFGRKLAPR